VGDFFHFKKMKGCLHLRHRDVSEPALLITAIHTTIAVHKQRIMMALQIPRNHRRSLVKDASSEMPTRGMDMEEETRVRLTETVHGAG
jgi:hypothetical protein